MPKLTLTPEEEKQNLRESVALANDFSDYQSTWKKKRYGPDEAAQFRRLLVALREWQQANSRNILWVKLEQRDREALEKYTQRIRVFVLPDGALSIESPTPWNEALYQFVRLLSNSRIALLGGPCLNRKKHNNLDFWFIRATRRPSVFCSRRCAGDATKASEREREHTRKIEKARRAIDNYAKRPVRFKTLSWQEYVINAEPSISRRFLTVAVRGGYLNPPTA